MKDIYELSLSDDKSAEDRLIKSKSSLEPSFEADPYKIGDKGMTIKKSGNLYISQCLYSITHSLYYLFTLITNFLSSRDY
jgi:hypothetical protein